MTAAMKEACLSVLYKGRGKNPEIMQSYRPVAILPVEYRIMTRAIKQKLTRVVEQIVSPSQVGYLEDGRQPHDNTLLLAEMSRLLEEPGKGGAALQVDNSAAFDRVRWDFMHRLLQEMGFPEEFREIVQTMYKGVNFTVKMNGITGEKQDQTQGVRQGCGVSPLLFLLVQEALLIHIRSSVQR